MQKGAEAAVSQATERPKAGGRFTRSLRRVGKTLRKAAFAAVPLLASFALGCEPDPCSSHNETTISLNRPTDGRIATLAELSQPPQECIISDAAIDLVNESHELSTGGMPGDASLTLVSQSCMRPNKSAYVYASSSITNDRGIYCRGPMIPTTTQNSYLDARTLFHELGHLQEGGWGNEVLPELNAAEQLLMVHVLLSRNDPSSQATWGFIMYGIEDTIYAYSRPSIISLGGVTERIAVFNLMELIRSDADFHSLRRKIIDLASRGTLQQEFVRTVSSYVAEYGDPDPAKEVTKLSNLVVSLRMSFARELSRRFGTETALAYLRAMSHKAVLSEEAMAEGLDGMNCAIMDRPILSLFESELPISNAPELCPELTSTLALYNIPEQRLCCVSPTVGSTRPDFQKHIIYVDGYSCTGYLPFPVDRVSEVRHFNIVRSVLLPDGAQCE